MNNPFDEEVQREKAGAISPWPLEGKIDGRAGFNASSRRTLTRAVNS